MEEWLNKFKAVKAGNKENEPSTKRMKQPQGKATAVVEEKDIETQIEDTQVAEMTIAEVTITEEAKTEVEDEPEDGRTEESQSTLEMGAVEEEVKMEPEDKEDEEEPTADVDNEKMEDLEDKEEPAGDKQPQTPTADVDNENMEEFENGDKQPQTPTADKQSSNSSNSSSSSSNSESESEGKGQGSNSDEEEAKVKATAKQVRAKAKALAAAKRLKEAAQKAELRKVKASLKEQNKELGLLKTRMRKWRYKNPCDDITLAWKEADKLTNEVQKELAKANVLELFKNTYCTELKWEQTVEKALLIQNHKRRKVGLKSAHVSILIPSGKEQKQQSINMWKQDGSKQSKAPREK